MQPYDWDNQFTPYGWFWQSFSEKQSHGEPFGS